MRYRTIISCGCLIGISSLSEAQPIDLLDPVGGIGQQTYQFEGLNDYGVGNYGSPNLEFQYDQKKNPPITNYGDALDQHRDWSDWGDIQPEPLDQNWMNFGQFGFEIDPGAGAISELEQAKILEKYMALEKRPDFAIQAMKDGSAIENTVEPANIASFQAFMNQGALNGISYPDLFNSLETEKRNELIYNNLIPPTTDLPTLQFQVVVGDPVDGNSGPQFCTGDECGTTQIVKPGDPVAPGNDGPICPESACPGSNGTVVGCADDLCNVGGRVNLDKDNDNKSDVTYIKEGYPEIIFLRRREFGKPTTRCTATAISQKWAITALHCFVLNDNIGLLDEFVLQSSDVIGWSVLAPKDTSVTGFDLVSDHLKEANVVGRIFVPFKHDTEPENLKGKLPRRDIALFRISGNGLAFKHTDFPVLDFGELDADIPISFAGFGWTDVNSIFGEDWIKIAIDLKWKELKQAAFNFLDDVRMVEPQKELQLVWNHGVPPGSGGPCHYDSGGPIYKGFNRGFWNSPRIVIGVVSALHPSAAAQAAGEDVQACLDKDSFLTGEMLASYGAGICELTSFAPRGCE